MSSPLMARFRSAAEGWRVAELAREPELSQFSHATLSRWIRGDIEVMNTRAAAAVSAWMRRVEAPNDETPPTGGGVDQYQAGLLDAAAMMSETVAGIIRRAQGVRPHDAQRAETRARAALRGEPPPAPGKRARG
jgi:hypothetical protein